MFNGDKCQVERKLKISGNRKQHALRQEIRKTGDVYGGEWHKNTAENEVLPLEREHKFS